MNQLELPQAMTRLIELDRKEDNDAKQANEQDLRAVWTDMDDQVSRGQDMLAYVPRTTQGN